MFGFGSKPKKKRSTARKVSSSVLDKRKDVALKRISDSYHKKAHSLERLNLSSAEYSRRFNIILREADRKRNATIVKWSNAKYR